MSCNEPDALGEKINFLSRDAKVVLFVLGTAGELASQGLLSGPNFLPLSPDGRAAFLRLKADGFRPTDLELDRAGRDQSLFISGPVGVA